LRKVKLHSEGQRQETERASRWQEVVYEYVVNQTERTSSIRDTFLWHLAHLWQRTHV